MLCVPSKSASIHHPYTCVAWKTIQHFTFTTCAYGTWTDTSIYFKEPAHFTLTAWNFCWVDPRYWDRQALANSSHPDPTAPEYRPGRQILVYRVCSSLSAPRLGSARVRAIWAASWQNQQNGMCAKPRLRSAWASAQSDQSLCCALNGKLRILAFFKWTAKTRIRLGGCPGWSESLLGAHAILLVLSRCSSFFAEPLIITNPVSWYNFSSFR